MITTEQLVQLINQWADEDPTHRTALVILQERSRVDENYEKAESHIDLLGKIIGLCSIFRHILSGKDADLKPLQRVILQAAAEALADRQGRSTDDEITAVETQQGGTYPWTVNCNGEA